jgi:hypothetical protein
MYIARLLASVVAALLISPGAQAQTSTVSVTTGGPAAIQSLTGLPGLRALFLSDQGVYSDNGCTQLATADGPVGCWTDQSGHGWKATQTTASAKPSWPAGVINGLPTVTCNGTSSFLNFPFVTEPSTIIVVHRYRALSYESGSFCPILTGDTSDTTSGGLGAYFLHEQTGWSNGIYRKARSYIRTTTNDNSWSSTQPSWQGLSHVWMNPWDIFGVRNDGSKIYNYKGGLLVSTTAIPSGATARPIDNAAICTDFVDHSPGHDFYNGDIAAIAIFYPVLSPIDYQTAVGVLQAKYGLGNPGPCLWAHFEGDSIDESLHAAQFGWRELSYLAQRLSAGERS